MHELLTQTLTPIVAALAHRAWDAATAAIRRRRTAGLYCTAPWFRTNEREGRPVCKPGGAQ